MSKPLKDLFKLTATLALNLYRVAVVVVLVFIAYSLYKFIIVDIIENDRYIVPFIILWLLTAYIVLPRLHRLLSGIYLPNYFVGRARTGDGFLGDPVNIAVIGSERQLHEAMLAAGWVEADQLNFHTTLQMIKSTVFRKSYPSAPVSSLFLFSRKQNFTYQQEVDGTPHARHHVRFWATPAQWWLPGGYKADWLAAATYDTHVGFSTLTGQITHKIATKTDEERDYVINTLKSADELQDVRVQKHFTSAFRDRNGGGDQIETDGSLPFITL